MMRLRLIVIFVLNLIFIINAKAAESELLSEWSAFTSLMNSKAAFIEGNNLWVATDGGAYQLDLATKKVVAEYRNINQLLSIKILAIHKSSNGNIYFASQDGTIDILSSDGTWEHILDIKNANFNDPSINTILEYNGRIYFAGGFGLAIFDPEEKVFIEDVKRFGDFAIQTAVHKFVIHNDSIWVATENGLAVAKLSNSIADRAIWKNYTVKGNESAIKSLVFHNDNLYCTSNNAIYKLQNDTLATVLRLSQEETISSLFEFDNTLLYSSQQNIYLADTSKTLYLNSLYKIKNTIQYNSELILLYETKGLAFWNKLALSFFTPNSPICNSFVDIAIDKQGAIWAASGILQSQGVMHYSQGQWSYLNSTNSTLANNAVIRTFVANDGSIYLSTFGGSQVRLQENGQKYEITNYNTPREPYTEVSENYIITGVSRESNSGVIWTSNWSASDGNSLVARDKNGNFRRYKGCSGNTFLTLAIDQAGTIWSGSAAADVLNYGTNIYYGLMYFNEKDPSKDNDNICGTINSASSSNLKSNHITALETDKSGFIWLGTDEGLSVVVNPTAVMGNAKPIIREVAAMRDQVINDILVDALDNKWLATKIGVFVLNSDGTDILRKYDKSNSPLPTNDIYSLATNPNTGEIFFGTTNGLYSAMTMAINPQEEYDVQVFPQPFNINQDENVIIDGLAESSDVRISTVDGVLIKQINTNSRKIAWDGTDSNGNKVAAGVYLILATSETQKKNAVAKIAVIRK